MNPLLLLAGGQGLSGIISGLLGGHELNEAKALEKQNTRPVEAVPQGVQDATAISKLLASTGMPAEQYTQAVAGIERSAASAKRTASESRVGVDAISTIQQGTNDALGNLSAQSAATRIQNMQAYARQLGIQGEWQDKVWQWNDAMKFEENAAAIRALKGAGWANINSMMNGLIGGGALALQGFSENKSSAKPTDPTLSSPELYSDGIPDQYTTYLQNIMALRQLKGN